MKKPEKLRSLPQQAQVEDVKDHTNKVLKLTEKLTHLNIEESLKLPDKLKMEIGIVQTIVMAFIAFILS